MKILLPWYPGNLVKQLIEHLMLLHDHDPTPDPQAVLSLHLM